MDTEPQIGDYVLATKWHDGDPGDHFCVGFCAGSRDHFGSTRHLVNDSEGLPFRAGGFRRAKRISARRAAWLVARFQEIEAGSHSVWWWARRAMR